MLTLQLWRRVFTFDIYLNFGLFLLNLSLMVFNPTLPLLTILAATISLTGCIWFGRKQLERDRQRMMDLLTEIS